MKKQELIKIIETVVRKEVKKQMNEIFIKDKDSSSLTELVSKPLIKKEEDKEPIRKQQVKPKKEVNYTSNKALNKVMNETDAGKSLIQQLEKIHKKYIGEFNKAEEDLKKEESLILSQKNILSEEEYKNKIDALKNKINIYNKERKEKIDSVTKKKVEATASLLKKINPILADYSKKNNISIIFRKKDIVLARSNLEITTQIIELVNSKVKKFKLN